MADYTYSNGDGLSKLDADTPNGLTEYVDILDDAIRQIKAYLKDPTAGPIPEAVKAAAPTGAIIQYGGLSAPDGWVFCDGAEVTQGSPYDNLYSVIGTQYNDGDEDPGNFRLPRFNDLKFLIGTKSDSDPEGIDIILARDTQTIGTDGQQLTSGEWRLRNLTELVYGSDLGASISANKITVPAGAWLVTARSSCRVGRSQIRLKNETTAETFTGSNAAGAEGPMGSSFAYARSVSSSPTVWSIDQQVATTSRIGFANSWAEEVYSEIMFQSLRPFTHRMFSYLIKL